MLADPLADPMQNPRSASPTFKALALFVSDVHLCESRPRTERAFLKFLTEHAPHSERLYLLGDLFEYWAGDDDLEHPGHCAVLNALAELSHRGVQLFWIAGNRDFLVGETFAKAIGAQILPDPVEVKLKTMRLTLAHGDALCTDDINYMQFRTMVRQAAWQNAFLAKPLDERKAIIESMRIASIADQKTKTMSIMDVNQDAVNALLHAHPCEMLIHGHTHRPAVHQENGAQRWVLPDWDYEDPTAQRGGWLCLNAEGQWQACSI